MEEKDIIDSWDKLISSGYNTGAMIICQLVGAPINSDKLGQNTTIEDGMISTKKQSGGAQHVQIAAHTGCIKYVAAVFDEELLIEAFGDAMEAVRGYSPGMHQSLRSVKTFIESGSSNAKDEPMVRLQNTLVKTASKNRHRCRLRLRRLPCFQSTCRLSRIHGPTSSIGNTLFGIKQHGGNTLPFGIKQHGPAWPSAACPGQNQFGNHCGMRVTNLSISSTRAWLRPSQWTQWR